MTVYKSKDLTAGLKIEINDNPYIILKVAFINIGRSQTFNKLKLKNILTNSLINKNFKINEKFKAADIISKNIKFLYSNNDLFYFFDNENTEYYEISINQIKNQKKWMKEGLSFTATFWNNNIIILKPPKFIELKVISTYDIKKDLGTHKNFKYAEIETHTKIKVPNFIKVNDFIKIDTESESYISRINI